MPVARVSAKRPAVMRYGLGTCVRSTHSIARHHRPQPSTPLTGDVTLTIATVWRPVHKMSNAPMPAYIVIQKRTGAYSHDRAGQIARSGSYAVRPNSSKVP